MSREKRDYHDNYVRILEAFGNVQLIPLKKAAEYVGIDYRTMIRAKESPVKKIAGRYYVPAVALARWLS